ncbi:Ankyrin repeat and SOCS box protein 3 [Orbilia ellipsospora]|uniref:Ankyrin repeat and SOCS box protein 3 n=1 Tax=Orbilia ellipsospora TaxID=2528407 RepID=A0AAV9XR85_9PEZI
MAFEPEMATTNPSTCDLNIAMGVNGDSGDSEAVESNVTSETMDSNEAEAPSAARPKRQVISQELWKQYEDLIKEIYVTEGRSLKYLRSKMADRGFEARYLINTPNNFITAFSLSQFLICTISESQFKRALKNFKVSKYKTKDKIAKSRTIPNLGDYTAPQQAGFLPSDPIRMFTAQLQSNHLGLDNIYQTGAVPDDFATMSYNMDLDSMVYDYSNYTSTRAFDMQMSDGLEFRSHPRIGGSGYLGGSEYERRSSGDPGTEKTPELLFHRGHEYLTRIEGSTPPRSTSSSIPGGRTKFGQAIHHAIQGGSFPIVELLLKKDKRCADSPTSDGDTPLWMACQQGNAKIATLLIEEYNVNVNATLFQTQRTALHQAAQTGNPIIVKLLLDNGAEFETRDCHGISPLWSAAQNGHDEIVKMLLDKEADTEIIAAGCNRRPLHQAAQCGHTKICTMLLDKKAQYEPLDLSGCSPLFLAAQGGYAEIVKILLAKGANPNNACVSGKGKGRTCLLQAVQGGHLEVVKLLLDGSPDIENGSKADPEPQVNIIYSRRQDDSSDSDSSDSSDEDSSKQSILPRKLARILKKKLANKASKGGPARKMPDHLVSPLAMAVVQGHYEIANLLIQKGANVNFVHAKTQMRPLHLAIARQPEKENLLRLLLDNGAERDARDTDGWTSMMFSARKGNCSIIKMLIDAKADINLTAHNGVTALHFAAQEGHTAAVKLLLENDAKPYISKNGWHPVHYAAAKAQFEVLKILVDQDPSCIHLKDKDGSSVLSVATMGPEEIRLQIVEYLIDKGAKVLEDDDE